MVRPIDEIKLSVMDDLASYEIGGRIPTMRAFAKQYRTSLGFVQSVFKQLEEENVLALSKKGHIGTFINDFSAVNAWKLLRKNEPIIVSLPLLTTKLFDGLATAIKLSFEKMGLDAYLTFLRGSGRRMTALRNGKCHLAVSSKLAATINLTPEEVILLELPPGTYIRQSRLYFIDQPYPTGGQSFRVAIDRDSFDLQRLTQMEFQNYKVELIPASFLQVPSLLKQGAIDACICDVDEAENVIPSSIKSRPLSPAVVETIGAQSYSATFIGKSSDHLLMRLVQCGLDAETLIQIQNEVLRDERIPEY